MQAVALDEYEGPNSFDTQMYVSYGESSSMHHWLWG